MKHGSLFSGIDGFGLGFTRAGFETSWGVEIDPDAQRVFRHHNPGVLLLSDVRECGKHNLPRVDVISFGSPCQDLSVAGKRAGLDGERSGLFHEAIRIVRELSPTLAVFENVPGLLSSHGGRDFATVLLAFRECGARDIAWRICDAQHWGVPQRRRRVFLVADFAGERAGEILFESPCGCRDFKKGRKKKSGTAPAVTPGARRASGNRAGEQLAVTLRSRNHRDGVNPPGRGGEDDQNLIVGSLPSHHQRNTAEDADRIVFQATEAGAERSGLPSLAASDDNGSNQIVIPIDMRQASRGETMTNNRGEGVASGGAPGIGVGEAGDPSPTLADTHTPVVYQCHGSNVGPMGTVRQGNGGLTGGVPFVVQEDGQNGVTMRDTAGSLRANAPGHQPCGSLIAHTLRAEGHDASEDGTGRGTPPVAFKESQSGTRTGDVHSTLDSHKGSRRQEGVMEGMSVRRLTPTECLRLQGFPDGYLDLDPALSDSCKYRLIGNSVAVPVVEWLGRRIMKSLEEE